MLLKVVIFFTAMSSLASAQVAVTGYLGNQCNGEEAFGINQVEGACTDVSSYNFDSALVENLPDGQYVAFVSRTL